MPNDNELVELKSYNSCFILNIYTKNYQEAIDFIKNKFADDNFFKNITLNSIKANNLDIIEVQRIKDFLKDELNIKYEEKEPFKKQEKQKKRKEKIEIETIIDLKEDKNYKTKIVNSSLRSGTSINYDGNILVIGDVNAGAELIATGNIIILGILRGFASAGAKGDKEAMVIANRINATQLRIAELIAVPPKNCKKECKGVQIAQIKENEIEIQQKN